MYNFKKLCTNTLTVKPSEQVSRRRGSAAHCVSCKELMSHEKYTAVTEMFVCSSAHHTCVHVVIHTCVCCNAIERHELIKYVKALALQKRGGSKKWPG